MTKPLRSRLIEAGARAIEERWLSYDRNSWPEMADSALDAFLDTLAENEDEWLGFAGTEQTEPIRRHVAARLIAVLRGED